MLRCPPSQITLTMSDIDHAFRRMSWRNAIEDAQRASTPPHVRRGAERLWEDAVTCNEAVQASARGRKGLPCRQMYTFDSSADSDVPGSQVSETPCHQADLSPSHLHKALSKLEVPTTAYVDPDTHLIRSFSTQMALDGTVDAPYGQQQPQTPHPVPVQSHPCPFGQNLPWPRSPLHKAHQTKIQEGRPRYGHRRSSSLGTGPQYSAPRKTRAATFSYNQPTNNDSYDFANIHQGSAAGHGTLNGKSRFANFRTRVDAAKAAANEVSNGPHLGANTSQDIYSALRNSRSHGGERKKQLLLRPPMTRLSSMSTPNLVSRTSSPEIISSRSRTASASVPTSVVAEGILRHASEPTSVGAKNKGPSCDPALLEKIGQHYCPLSPLDKVEKNACSEYSNAPSIASLYSALTGLNQPYFQYPSFGSPESQESPELAPYMPLTPKRTSSSGSVTNGSESHMCKAAQVSTTPSRVRDFALPPPEVSASTLRPDPHCTPKSGRKPSNDAHCAHGSTSSHAEFSQAKHYKSHHISPTSSRIPARFPNDSAVELSSSDQLRVSSRPATSQTITYPRRTRPDLEVLDTALVPSGHLLPRPAHSPPSASAARTFAVFSPGLGGFGVDDLSRYPPPPAGIPSVVGMANRLSMPSSASSSESTAGGSRVSPSQAGRTGEREPSRRPGRPYSHGARPRARALHSHLGYSSGLSPSHHPSHQQAFLQPSAIAVAGNDGNAGPEARPGRSRSFTAANGNAHAGAGHGHGYADARMPPVPQPVSFSPPSLPARSRTAMERSTGSSGRLTSGSQARQARRNPNQENDGSGEMALMREEMGGVMRWAGGGDGNGGYESVGRVVRSGGGGVMDDTPPREGRWERLMRETGSGGE